MNVERLLMVKAMILKHPERTCMLTLHSGGCHCIFGWAQVLFSNRFLDRFWLGRFVKKPDSEEDLFGYVGLSYAQARRLYYVGMWPQELFDRWCAAGRGSAAQARVVADAIDSFIADPGWKKDTPASPGNEFVAAFR